MDEYSGFFQRILDNREATLRSFQTQVMKHVTTGRNVVLRAPTGAGKTWAAILGFLYERVHLASRLDGVIYAVPLRALGSDIHDSLHCGLSRILAVSDDPVRKDEASTLSLTIQMGGQGYDPHLRGEVIVSTIDQVLTAYLARPVALSSGQSNINLGALLGKLIIFDEVHLLESNGALVTLIEMARRLKGLSQFLLMTATLSQTATETIAGAIDAEIVTLTADDLSALPAHRDKERKYTWVGRPIEATDIVRHHKNRTIVVCNTVARAQELFMDVRALAAQSHPNCQVILIHNRFYAHHRVDKEKLIRKLLGPDAHEGDVIVVATQVIEAGLDISADVLHTDLCPANSVVQRAGRCARYGTPRNGGEVLVYDLPNNRRGNWATAPYNMWEKNWKTLTRTRQYLEKASGQVMSALDEEQFVDAVHSCSDTLLAESLSSWVSDRADQVDRLWATLGAGNVDSYLREAVRDVDSVSVLLTSQPENLDLLQRPQFISIPRQSLGYLRYLTDQPECPIKVYRYNAENSSDEWVPISPEQAVKAVGTIALPSWSASYTEELGLRLGVPGDIECIAVQPQSRNHKDYCYTTETWLEHARTALLAASTQRKQIPAARERLGNLLGISMSVLTRLEDLTVGLHDVGKLSVFNQRAYRRWLEDYHPDDLNLVCVEPLAHTRVDNRHEIRMSREYPYRPNPHGGEGAFASAAFVTQAISAMGLSDNLSRQAMAAVLLSIATHHGGAGTTVQAIALEQHAPLLVQALFPDLRWIQPVENPDARRRFQELVLSGLAGQNRQGWLLYFHLVRMLRLADQAASEAQKMGRR